MQVKRLASLLLGMESLMPTSEMPRFALELAAADVAMLAAAGLPPARHLEDCAAASGIDLWHI